METKGMVGRLECVVKKIMLMPDHCLSNFYQTSLVTSMNDSPYNIAPISQALGIHEYGTNQMAKTIIFILTAIIPLFFCLVLSAAVSAASPTITDVSNIAFFVNPPNAFYLNFVFAPKGDVIYAKVSDGHVHRLEILSGKVLDLGHLMDGKQWYESQHDIHPKQDLLLIAGGKESASKTIDILNLKDGSIQKTIHFPGRGVLFRYAYFVNEGEQLLVFAYTESQSGETKRVFFLVDLKTEAITEKIIPLRSRPEPGFALNTQRNKIALITATDDANDIVIYDQKNQFKQLHKVSLPLYNASNIVFTNNDQSFIYYNDFAILNSEIELGIAMRQFDKDEDDFGLFCKRPIEECAASSDGNYMFISSPSTSGQRRGGQLFVSFKAGKAIGSTDLMNIRFSCDCRQFAAITASKDNAGIVVYNVDAINRVCITRGVRFPYVKKIQ